jgi:phosphoribosylaminoimidazolecarboxamide formyltransferase / IMP cyclohydrolase
LQILEPFPIKRALISVSDKSGLDTLLASLAKYNVEIISTGGTEVYIRNAGYEVKNISALTGFPEIMDGRVKTLHPSVHGAFLFKRDVEEHKKQAEENNIVPIDLLVLNLYPFEATIAKDNVSHEEIIENIDIGGPAMLRSAGKNYESVALLTDPVQYAPFIEELLANNGATTHELRLRLASEAFARVAHYDMIIARYFEKISPRSSQQLLIDEPRVATPRYGENPHQTAAIYGKDVSRLYEQLWGKELSYNNYLDASASLSIISEFIDSEKPVAGIVKHTNPCGIAEGKSVLDAFEMAFATDTESPFGGIIVTNMEFTEELALRVNEFFSEVILAPSYSEAALSVLKKKKDRRLIKYDKTLLKKSIDTQEVRTIAGGILVQDTDTKLMAYPMPTLVTSHEASSEDQAGLLFAWKVCKHVKSNAIVYVRNDKGYGRTLGIGCGQTSRVASSRLAVANAERFGHSLKGSLVASDAFFPFADGLLEAADAGAVAVIEPGGSVRDEEVIKAAEERKISLYMTGMRHFKH